MQIIDIFRCAETVKKEKNMFYISLFFSLGVKFG